MKRIFGSLLVTCLSLAGCGTVQSPDFEAALRAVDITFTPVTGSSIAKVAPAGTIQFTAVGLYTTPPGTKAGTDTVPCPINTEPQALCTRGTVSGVTWSVDAVSNTAGAFASVDTAGRATGLRRGTATVRAKVPGLEDATEPLLVDGEVLESITISSAPVSGSVPTGRTLTLTATPTCSQTKGGPAGTCTRTDYPFTWSLPSNFASDTVTFSTNPPVGRTITFKTNRFGTFSLDVKVNNEEGATVQQSVPLNATLAVLDSISIVPSGGSLPANIPLGTPADFQLRGVLTNGEVVFPVRAADLKADTKVEWSKENNSANSRGDVTLEDQTGKTSPNSALRITGARLGPTNLTAMAVNTANEPPLMATTQLANGISGINVIDATVTSLTQLCPASAAADVCPQNVQIPLSASVKFRVRGNYSDNVVREVPAERLDWTTRAGTGAVTVNTETPASLLQGQGYTGSGRGAATLVATLKPEFRSNVSTFVVESPVVVVDAVCSDELFNGNGSVTTATTAGTTAMAPSSVSNTGNLIDNNPSTFANFSISAALTNSVLAASINRPARVVAATTMQPKSVGALFKFTASQFNPAQQSQIVLLDAMGNTIGMPLSVTASTVMRGTEQLTRVSAPATVPFTGFRILVQVPNVTAITPISGGSFDPSFLATLQAILGGGGSIQVQADSACADLR